MSFNADRQALYMRNSACIPAHLKRRRYTSTAAVSLSDSTRRSRWMTASMPTPCSPAHQFAQHWARPHTNRPLCCSARHRELRFESLRQLRLRACHVTSE